MADYDPFTEGERAGKLSERVAITRWLCDVGAGMRQRAAIRKLADRIMAGEHEATQHKGDSRE